MLREKEKWKHRVTSTPLFKKACFILIPASRPLQLMERKTNKKILENQNKTKILAHRDRTPSLSLPIHPSIHSLPSVHITPSSVHVINKPTVWSLNFSSTQSSNRCALLLLLLLSEAHNRLKASSCRMDMFIRTSSRNRITVDSVIEKVGFTETTADKRCVTGCRTELHIIIVVIIKTVEIQPIRKKEKPKVWCCESPQRSCERKGEATSSCWLVSTP